MLVPGTPDEAAGEAISIGEFWSLSDHDYPQARRPSEERLHAGFASLATGEEHVRLTTAKERALIEQLLAEKAPQSQKATGGF